MFNNRPLLIILQAEIKSEVQALYSSGQKVYEVTGPIYRPGFPGYRINLNNPPNKNKIQAIKVQVQIIKLAKGRQRFGSE